MRLTRSSRSVHPRHAAPYIIAATLLASACWLADPSPARIASSTALLRAPDDDGGALDAAAPPSGGASPRHKKSSPKPSDEAARDSSGAPQKEGAVELHAGSVWLRATTFPQWVWVPVVGLMVAVFVIVSVLALRKPEKGSPKISAGIMVAAAFVLVCLSFGFAVMVVRGGDRSETSVSLAQTEHSPACDRDILALGALLNSAHLPSSCPPVLVSLAGGAPSIVAAATPAVPTPAPPTPNGRPEAADGPDPRPTPDRKEPTAAAPAPAIMEGFLLPMEVKRGAQIAIPIAALPDDAAVLVELLDVNRAKLALIARAANGQLTFALPGDIKPGRYTVEIRSGTRPPLQVPGDLRVAADENAIPLIDELPALVYPGDGGSGYSFTIAGDRFGDRGDTAVVVQSHPPITAGELPCDEHARAPCLNVSRRAIEVHGFRPNAFEGPTQLLVQVGALESKPAAMTFARVGAVTVRLISLMATFALAVSIYFVMRAGVGWYRVGTANYNPIKNFIIDRDTGSYSLSKLQVLMWTAVGVFTYIYLFACRILIQWQSTLPDIPNGMGTLLGLSVGTAVAASGLTAVRGPKGAGPNSPTPADLITSGGIVVPERFQFLVWTIVGVLSFVGLVLSSDPAKLATLPEIPQNFLALMGVSAAGYLAGKSVRAQGPVVNRVDVTKGNDSKRLELTISGVSLEPNPTVRIDQKTYPAKIEPLTKQSGSADLYTGLQCSIEWKPEFSATKHTLEVVNSDGQSAALEFTIASITIGTLDGSTANLVASAQEQTLSVLVRHSVGALRAEWTAPDDVAAVPASVSQKDGVAIVKLTTGTKPGIGRLTVIDEMGQRAILSVQVSAASTTPTAAEATAS